MWDLDTIKRINADTQARVAENEERARTARAGDLHDEILEYAHNLFMSQDGTTLEHRQYEQAVKALHKLYIMATSKAR